MDTRVPETSSFWRKKGRKALKIKGWKAPNQLVRMRSPVQIRIAAPQKPLFSLEKGGVIFGGERTTSYTGGLPPYALAKSSESDKKVSNRR